MEALRQSAAAAQMNPPTTPTVPVSGAPPSMDLVRLQMEQQMMERYMAALSSASALGATVATSMAAPSFDFMRHQLFAAQMRQQAQQQQQQQQQAQPTLDALFEMQRQQQQQQLLTATRNLSSGYSALTAPNPGATNLQQSLGAAAGLFNTPHLMSIGAAANLQQALYGKNPYSNTLEQLARQKRDEDMMQSGR